MIYPEIDPVALSLGPLKIHWYGLMYLVGMVGGWALARWRIRRCKSDWTARQVDDLLFYCAVGVVLGGRLGYILFYGFNDWLEDPVRILRVWEGGMSFHGGFLGVLAAMWLYRRKHGKGFFELTDFIAPYITIGLFTGRLGNFINGELWGKPTDLPWAMQLPQLITDPSPMLPILKALRNDNEEYVTRSVANHLNDIAKDHPDRVASLALEWMKGADKAREKLVRHACRTLIKQGHTTALKAFGIGPPRLELEVLKIDTPTVNFGDALEFSAQLRSTGKNTQSLIIDYLIHFKKANGTLVAKVFKWTKLTLEPGETRTLTKKHPIRPITTRRYYAGQQGLSLRINGQDFGDAQFGLTMPDQD